MPSGLSIEGLFGELKRLRMFGNIIESMRTDAFLYKVA
jgi:hypothetical protein